MNESDLYRNWPVGTTFADTHAAGGARTNVWKQNLDVLKKLGYVKHLQGSKWRRTAKPTPDIVPMTDPLALFGALGWSPGVVVDFADEETTKPTTLHGRETVNIWPGFQRARDYYGVLWPIIDKQMEHKKPSNKERKALAATRPTTLEEHIAAERYVREMLQSRLDNGPDCDPQLDEDGQADGAHEIQSFGYDVRLDALVWEHTVEELGKFKAQAAAQTHRPRAPRGKPGKLRAVA